MQPQHVLPMATKCLRPTICTEKLSDKVLKVVTLLTAGMNICEVQHTPQVLTLA